MHDIGGAGGVGSGGGFGGGSGSSAISSPSENLSFPASRSSSAASTSSLATSSFPGSSGSLSFSSAPVSGFTSSRSWSSPASPSPSSGLSLGSPVSVTSSGSPASSGSSSAGFDPISAARGIAGGGSHDGARRGGGSGGGGDGAGRSGGGGSGDLTFAGSGRAALAVAWDPGAALGLAGEAELSWSLPSAGGGAASAIAAEDAAQTDAARAQAARDGAAAGGALGPNHGSPQVRAASRTDDPYEPTPPPDTVLQQLREGVASTAGRTVGGAQALGGFAADMVGGGAAVVEKGYEAAVAGVEAATDWISDDHAQRQRADLDARTDAFIEAAEEVLSDPIGVATAIAGGFEARYAQADALEAAYRSGHGDLSVYREAERIRAVADKELTILGVETAAVAAGGTGAAAKALRAARIADRVDGAAPIAAAMAAAQRARAGAGAVDMLTVQPGRRARFSAEDVVRWVDENASMSPAARDYDDGATGSRSSVETRLGQAPSIERTLPSGETRPVRSTALTATS